MSFYFPNTYYFSFVERWTTHIIYIHKFKTIIFAMLPTTITYNSSLLALNFSNFVFLWFEMWLASIKNSFTDTDCDYLPHPQPSISIIPHILGSDSFCIGINIIILVIWNWVSDGIYLITVIRNLKLEGLQLTGHQKQNMFITYRF